MNNIENFQQRLALEYTELFKLPAYAAAAKKHTPESLAAVMTNGLLTGSADKDGAGVKAVCKALGIKCTYKAIEAFLKGQ